MPAAGNGRALRSRRGCRERHARRADVKQLPAREALGQLGLGIGLVELSLKLQDAVRDRLPQHVEQPLTQHDNGPHHHLAQRLWLDGAFDLFAQRELAQPHHAESTVTLCRKTWSRDLTVFSRVRF